VLWVAWGNRHADNWRPFDSSITKLNFIALFDGCRKITGIAQPENITVFFLRVLIGPILYDQSSIDLPFQNPYGIVHAKRGDLQLSL